MFSFFFMNMTSFEAFCLNKKLTSYLCFLKCVWEVFSYYIISILTCYDCYMGPRITIFFLFERILLHYFLEYFWSNQNFLAVFCPRVFLIQLSCKCLCRDIMMLNWLKFVKTIVHQQEPKNSIYFNIHIFNFRWKFLEVLIFYLFIALVLWHFQIFTYVMGHKFSFFLSIIIIPSLLVFL